MKHNRIVFALAKEFA